MPVRHPKSFYSESLCSKVFPKYFGQFSWNITFSFCWKFDWCLLFLLLFFQCFLLVIEWYYVMIGCLHLLVLNIFRSYLVKIKNLSFWHLLFVACFFFYVSDKKKSTYFLHVKPIFKSENTITLYSNYLYSKVCPKFRLRRPKNPYGKTPSRSTGGVTQIWL